jgi:carbonic anhydrase
MFSRSGQFASARAWANQRVNDEPGWFGGLARQPAPRYLWIGCVECREPAHQLIGLEPGEVFVHRSIANQVHDSDPDCLAVLRFAVQVLKVEHIMVVGHHGCTAIEAVLAPRCTGPADDCLQQVQDLAHKHAPRLAALSDALERGRSLVALNVIEQVTHLCRSSILHSAWQQGQKLEVHGLVHGLDDGLLRRVGGSIDGTQSWDAYHAASVNSLG